MVGLLQYFYIPIKTLIINKTITIMLRFCDKQGIKGDANSIMTGENMKLIVTKDADISIYGYCKIVNHFFTILSTLTLR
jgi:hypothetical protein